MACLLGGGGDVIPHRVGVARCPALSVARKNNKSVNLQYNLYFLRLQRN